MGLWAQTKRKGLEKGEGMVSVLVAVAVLGTIIAAVGVGLTNIYRARRHAAMSEGARDLESAMVQVLAEKWSSLVLANCASTEMNGNLVRFIEIGNEADLDSGSAAKSTLSSAFASTDADFYRCNNKASRISGISDPKATGFYMCYKLIIDTNKFRSNDRDTIAFNKGSFVQVIVNIKKLGDDTAATCEDVRTGQGYGLEVYYMTKWIMDLNRDKVTKTQVGSFNVAL
jgi:hypothetical protein